MFYVVDSLKDTVAKNGTWDSSSPLGRIAHSMLIVKPPGGWLHDTKEHAPVFLGPSTVEGEPCYAVQFADPKLEEHVYGAFSTNDSLPRRLDWVAADATGVPRVVHTRITNLQTRTVVPEGFFDPDSVAFGSAVNRRKGNR